MSIVAHFPFELQSDRIIIKTKSSTLNMFSALKLACFCSLGKSNKFNFKYCLINCVEWHCFIECTPVVAAAGHFWDLNPDPGSGDWGNFDNNCPLGKFDPADNTTVCAIVLPSSFYLKDFSNAGELVRYNCLQPTAREFHAHFWIVYCIVF